MSFDLIHLPRSLASDFSAVLHSRDSYLFSISTPYHVAILDLVVTLNYPAPEASDKTAEFLTRTQPFLPPGLTVKDCYSLRTGESFCTLFGKGQDPQVSSCCYFFPQLVPG